MNETRRSGVAMAGKYFLARVFFFVRPDSAE
jgi:hypothetical protein